MKKQAYSIKTTYAETVDLIAAVGSEVSVIVEGHIGSGKSSLINALAERCPTHRKVYMDMTVMHEGDIRIPAINHEKKTTEFYYNESFGLHDNVPVILMLDEYGKASKPVKDATMPALVERRFGNFKLHPDSIVFATTNLGAENVGDVFQAHHRNRLSSVQMQKTDAETWINDWAKLNNIAPEILMWVGERPDVLHPYDYYDNPNDNVHIYHPKAQRSAFVTHRSLEQASKVISKRDMFSPAALEAALAGTVGAPAAVDLQAWIAMGDSLPKRAEIIGNPSGARVPDQVAGKLMLTYQAINWVDDVTIDSWMDYMSRMDKEVQALFCTTVIKKPNKAFVLECDKFTSFAIKNQYLFA